MIEETVTTDVTVVGGGLAGVCAAIAAARRGATVSLVQNRPVLGGNSSSEVRVWVVGATSHGMHRYARETGIIGELVVENQFRNPEGNPYYWDLVVLDAVRAEPGIRLFLNTDVRSLSADGPDDARVIRSVDGWTMGSERSIRFVSEVFIDCTGDGLLGALAGIDHRIGREASSEYDESFAPAEPDSLTLGSTLLFYSKDIGRPVPFYPPSFAKDITTTPIPTERVIKTGMNGASYWWIEWGGELDVVGDNERIRDELWSVIYGVWDHIKNSGDFEADSLTLEWVGSVPGKREYRRFVGEHTLTQNDVLGQRVFDDRIGFGGWSIDLHPPGGMYATGHASTHALTDGSYHLPLSMLYSRRMSNMLFAGRNVSASHVAFGSTRVMATCATMGEAVGALAATAVETGRLAHEVAREDVRLIQRSLLREDGSLLGVEDDDVSNLVLGARATASSTLRLIEAAPGAGEPQTRALDTDLGILVPADPGIDGLELRLRADSDTRVTVKLYSTSAPQNYIPHELQSEASATVLGGAADWVRFDLTWRPEHRRNAIIVVEAAEGVEALVAESAPPGTLTFFRRERTGENERGEVLNWPQTLHRAGLSMRMTAPTDAFAPARGTTGFARPYGGPNMWVSAPTAEDPTPWLAAEWDSDQAIGRVDVVLDDDVAEDLINLHHHRTPFAILPSLLRDFRVEARIGGAWTTVGRVDENRRRHHTVVLDPPIRATAIRVVAESTNGAAQARIVALRAYSR